LRFAFEGVARKPVWAMLSHGAYVYAGTGPDGKVFRSSDLSSWEEFAAVGDAQVRSLAIWNNGLFMGTEPNGRIYVHNFTTGRFYWFVGTYDNAVTCFASYGNKLYAGTKPGGLVYSFNGTKWTQEYSSYGHGINAMSVFQNKLYVFMDNAESPIVYDGTTWSLMPEAATAALKQKLTISAFRKATPEPVSFVSFNEIKRADVVDVDIMVAKGELDAEDRLVITPPSPVFSLKSPAVDGTRILFGSADKGRVFSYDGQKTSQVFDVDSQDVRAAVNISSGNNIVAIGDTLYLLRG
jgi:WD40 repeat protein